MQGFSRPLGVLLVVMGLASPSADAAATYTVSSRVTYRITDTHAGVFLKSIGTPPGDFAETNLGDASSKGAGGGTVLSDGLELLAEAAGQVGGPPGFGSATSFGLARGSIQIENTTGADVEIGLLFEFRLSIDLFATNLGANAHGIAHLRVTGLSVARLTRNLAVGGPGTDGLLESDRVELRLTLPGHLRFVTANLTVLASGVAQAVPEPRSLISAALGSLLLGTVAARRGRFGSKLASSAI